MPAKSSKAQGLRDYNEVAERVAGFNEQYPEGRIVTQICGYDVHIDDVVEEERSSGSTYRQPLARGVVCVRAEVYRLKDDEHPSGVGHSAMLIPGITQYTRDSELENAETSAVGRALAFIGFYAKGESLASKQEIAAKGGDSRKPSSPKADSKEQAPKGLTSAQKKKLFAAMREYAPAIADDSAKRKTFVFLVTASINREGKLSTADMTDSDFDAVIEGLRKIEEEPYKTFLADSLDVESVEEKEDD